MPNILKTEAEDIFKKLKKKSPKKANRSKFEVEKREGGDHTIVSVYYDTIKIGQYGIRRGGKEQSHNFIPSQLHLSSTQAYDLAKCPFSVDDYIDVLIGLGEIDDPDASLDR